MQTHCPYPATPTLLGALRHVMAQSSSADPIRQWTASQADFSLEFFLSVFTEKTLSTWASPARKKDSRLANRLMQGSGSVDSVVAFLQGHRPDLARPIASRVMLPEGPRFAQLTEHAEAYAALNETDQAKHLASLFLNDMADCIGALVDSRFAYARYAEKLAASAPTFDALQRALNQKPTPLVTLLQDLTLKALNTHRPDTVAITIPFPGNVFGALLIAQAIKTKSPHIKVIVGGGTPNTEWRSIDDPRIFKYFDFICLDDGARPLIQALKVIQGAEPMASLKRTFHLDSTSNKVTWTDATQHHDIPLSALGTPDYDGLPLDHYVGLLEVPNAVQRLWTDGRWLKLTLAQGCYWKKCSFCDTSLPYIRDYYPDRAASLVDKMERMLGQTRWAKGWDGFHFTDEAAPPALLGALADELIRRGLRIRWWGNVRFEKAFTPELARKLALSGCIALTGGLEVASDRLLKLMQKGITVAQVAKTTKALSDAGIMVHAYLMYGFPTQTTQETVDSLEMVRQLFDSGCIRSAFWHRLSVTAHSPMGKDPATYRVNILPQRRKKGRHFAENDLPFEEIPLRGKPAHHDALGVGLRQALHAYKVGQGLHVDVHRWFPMRAPKTTVARSFVRTALDAPLR